MSLLVSDTSQVGAAIIPVPGKIDGVTITFDIAYPRGSSVVDRAVTLSTDDTYALAATGEEIAGVLFLVDRDGKCTIHKGEGLEAPAGTGASVTPGKKIVGAQRSSAKGYIKEADYEELAEIACARGQIINNDNLDKVVFSLYERPHQGVAILMSTPTKTRTAAPAMIVLPSLEDFQRATGIHDQTAARTAYEAVLSRPDGREQLRAIAGSTITDDMIKLADRLEPGMYKQAEKDGVPFSEILRKEAPAPKGSRHDTFEHLLALMQIRTKHDLERGVRASKVQEVFDAHDGKGAILMPELMQRAFLNGMRWGTSWVRSDISEQRYLQRFYASTSVLSKLLQPEFVNAQFVAPPLRPTILEQLVATTEPLTGTDAWRQFYVDMSDVEARRMLRVPQGSLLPTVTISGTDHTGYMKAYGRRILMTYEVSQWSVPMIQLHLSLFGAQMSIDEVAALLSVLINGDGNAGTEAGVTNISDLVLVASGSTTNIPAEGILEYTNTLEESTYFTRPTICVARAIGKTLLQQAKFADSNTRLFVGATPVRPGEAQTTGLSEMAHPPVASSADAPTHQLVYVDGTQAAVRYVGAATPVTETNRIIANRMDEITIWTKWGHQILMPGSVNILDYSL